MKSKIVKVGNSKGVIIPASFIKECHLEEEVEMEIRDDGILIRPIQHPRAGWEEAFKELSEEKNQMVMEDFPPTDFESSEWQW
jgi:antitoxin MazE